MSRFKFMLPVAALLLAGVAWSADDDTARRQVRVAGGVTLELATSGQSNAEWAKRRPNFEALKPKKRDR